MFSLIPITQHQFQRSVNFEMSFGVFTFFQKTNKNKSTSNKVELVRSFFGKNVGLKKIEFVWPLGPAQK